MAALLTLNHGGMAELLKSDDVRAMLTDRAAKVLAAAQEAAPVVSGAYKASLGIQQATTDRVAVRVGATVPYALVVEAEDGVLTRALSAAGG